MVDPPEERKGDQKVAFHKLFAFADSLDVAAIILGTAGAIGNGLAPPLMAVVFGQLVNSFGATDTSHVVHEVSKVIILQFLFSSFLGFCFCISCNENLKFVFDHNW